MVIWNEDLVQGIIGLVDTEVIPFAERDDFVLMLKEYLWPSMEAAGITEETFENSVIQAWHLVKEQR